MVRRRAPPRFKAASESHEHLTSTVRFETPGVAHAPGVSLPDLVWSRLRLWRDSDHDAFSAPSELTTLDSAGVHSFSLDAQSSNYIDEYGNEFRFTSTIAADAPVSTAVSDVWLVQAPIPVMDVPVDDDVVTPRDYTLWTCWAWGYAERAAYPFASCDNNFVAGDPLVTGYNGRLRKLVARWSSSTNRLTAVTRAQDTVFHAENGLTGQQLPVGDLCENDTYPTPDPYYPPPYDYNTLGEGVPVASRVKCFSELIHSGGGGGGGC